MEYKKKIPSKRLVRSDLQPSRVARDKQTGRTVGMLDPLSNGCMRHVKRKKMKSPHSAVVTRVLSFPKLKGGQHRKPVYTVSNTFTIRTSIIPT